MKENDTFCILKLKYLVVYIYICVYIFTYFFLANYQEIANQKSILLISQWFGTVKTFIHSNNVIHRK